MIKMTFIKTSVGDNELTLYSGTDWAIFGTPLPAKFDIIGVDGFDYISVFKQHTVKSII